MADYDNVWAPQVLFAKTQRFIELATECDRDSWLYPFWSTLALETLARTAVAHESPMLLADTADRSSHHLLYAAGIPPNVRSYTPKSIAATEVFRRCEAICDGFTNEHFKFCSGMTARRNAELHSGATPFENLKMSHWLGRLYETAEILLSHLGQELEALFGEEASAARTMIASLADEAAKQVEQLVKEHKVTWEEKDDEARQRAALIAESTALRSFGHRVDCPACGSNALLFGSAVGDSRQDVEDDVLVERQVMLPTHLSCEACGLRVDGHARLNAIELGGTFTRTDRWDPVEYFGIQADALEEQYWEQDYNE